jgi:hypothetical protein
VSRPRPPAARASARQSRAARKARRSLRRPFPPQSRSGAGRAWLGSPAPSRAHSLWTKTSRWKLRSEVGAGSPASATIASTAARIASGVIPAVRKTTGLMKQSRACGPVSRDGAQMVAGRRAHTSGLQCHDEVGVAIPYMPMDNRLRCRAPNTKTYLICVTLLPPSKER